MKKSKKIHKDHKTATEYFLYGLCAVLSIGCIYYYKYKYNNTVTDAKNLVQIIYETDKLKITVRSNTTSDMKVDIY